MFNKLSIITQLLEKEIVYQMSSVEEVIIKNPLSPRNLYNLLFHPSRLFAPNIFIRSKFWTLFVIFPFFGLTIFFKRIDTSDLVLFNKYNIYPIENVHLIAYFYEFFYSLYIWYIAGWFFNLKLKWCGTINHDNHEGRLIMVYTAFIIYLFDPIISYILKEPLKDINFNLIDKNNISNFISDNFIPLLLCFLLNTLLLIYSNVITYIAVKSKFEIRGIKPIFWFIIFPTFFSLQLWSLITAFVA